MFKKIKESHRIRLVYPVSWSQSSLSLIYSSCNSNFVFYFLKNITQHVPKTPYVWTKSMTLTDSCYNPQTYVTVFIAVQIHVQKETAAHLCSLWGRLLVPTAALCSQWTGVSPGSVTTLHAHSMNNTTSVSGAIWKYNRQVSILTYKLGKGPSQYCHWLFCTIIYVYSYN